MPSEINNKSNNKFEGPITTVYLLTTGLVTIISNFSEDDSILNLMKLNYNKIIKKYEFWRLLTCFLYIGKPSPRLIFNYYLYYKRMKSTEYKYTKNKKLAEFIMMLFYLIIFIHLCNFLAFILFKFKTNSFLSHQLMFSLILINSKRNPEKLFRFYFAQIPNKFVPYFLFTLRAIKSGKIYKHLISFIPGLGYYYLKDVLPQIDKNFDILTTPKFLEDFAKKNIYGKIRLKKKVLDNNKNENTNINRDTNNTDEKHISNGKIKTD